LRVANHIDGNKSLDSELGRLLEVVVDFESDMAVGINIARPNGKVLVVWRSQVAGAHHDHGSREQSFDSGRRMFPQRAVEHSAVLPAPFRGRVYLAATRMEQLTDDSAKALLEQMAAVIAVAVRAWDDSNHITDLEAQTAQLEKLSTIGRSAAGIVHELNNPLTAIVAYSDYLARSLKQHDATTAELDRLDKIQEAALRIQRFARDLIDYSRPSLRVHAPLDVGELIERALGFCSHQLQSNDVRVIYTRTSVPLINGEESPLTQVLVNLFTNAGHAMDEHGGTLCIETKVNKTSLAISVSDDGHGIEEQHLEHLFDPYFTTKPQGQGVGLGLSIVKQIIVDHGGQIRVERKHSGETVPSRGTVFFVELPIPD